MLKRTGNFPYFFKSVLILTKFSFLKKGPHLENIGAEKKAINKKNEKLMIEYLQIEITESNGQK